MAMMEWNFDSAENPQLQLQKKKKRSKKGGIVCGPISCFSGQSDTATEEKEPEPRGAYEKSIVLLGPAEVGKSTVLKQMRLCSSTGGFDDPLELDRIAATCKHNAVKGMEDILMYMESKCKLHEVQESLGEVVQEVIDFCKDYKLREKIPPDIVGKIDTIWHDPVVEDVYDQDRFDEDFMVMDCAKYFLDRIQDVSLDTYKPTKLDILHAREKTTKLQMKLDFQFGRGKKTEFVVHDFGGQRGLREQWLQVKHPKAVIFVVALSDYNKTMQEDSDTNRLKDAFAAFKDVAKREELKDVSKIVLLNKKDIFDWKLRDRPFGDSFPEYEGANRASDVIQFISGEFKKRSNGYIPHIHVTTATNADQMEHVIATIFREMTINNLFNCGLGMSSRPNYRENVHNEEH